MDVGSAAGLGISVEAVDAAVEFSLRVLVLFVFEAARMSWKGMPKAFFHVIGRVVVTTLRCRVIASCMSVSIFCGT